MWVYGKTTPGLANEKAQETFGQETYSFRRDKYQIRVKKIAINGNRDSLNIDMLLSGTIEGMVSIQGRPKWNPTEQKLEIRDFQYNTEAAKVHISTFIRWLFAKKIKRQLKEALEAAIAEQVQSIRQDIEKNLEEYPLNDMARLYGHIQDFYFDKVWVDENWFQVRAFLGGNFQVKLDIL